MTSIDDVIARLTTVLGPPRVRTARGYASWGSRSAFGASVSCRVHGDSTGGDGIIRVEAYTYVGYAKRRVLVVRGSAETSPGVFDTADTVDAVYARRDASVPVLVPVEVAAAVAAREMGICPERSSTNA